VALRQESAVLEHEEVMMQMEWGVPSREQVALRREEVPSHAQAFEFAWEVVEVLEFVLLAESEAVTKEEGDFG
jgi:hypothetical protein